MASLLKRPSSGESYGMLSGMECETCSEKRDAVSSLRINISPALEQFSLRNGLAYPLIGCHAICICMLICA
jgi:hypothetical protein